LVYLVDGLPAIDCFSTHLLPGMGFQQGTQAAAHHFVIVSDQYAKRGHTDLRGPDVFLQFADRT